MSSAALTRVMTLFYVALFFAYLFGPLVLMGISAFNTEKYPTAVPWSGFTLEWFNKLFNDTDLVRGFQNSLIIGAGVVVLSVPIGLAAAIIMSQLHRRARSIYYAVVLSPMLTPGVIIGISTLVFWDRLGTALDAEWDTFFYDGIFLSILGQTSFISTFCMLIFIARLQRFDRAQEEAALDLGASHLRVFFRILIPFLRPAVFAAIVLAFLTSFENYNTTVFTIVSESTLTTVLAGKVRLGTDPSISALAVLIILITLVGATAIELRKRAEERKIAAQLAAEKGL